MKTFILLSLFYPLQSYSQVEQLHRNFGIDKPVSIERDVVTPTEKLKVSDYPKFTDDLNFRDMDKVIDLQLQRFKKRNMNHTLQFGQDIYEYKDVEASIIEFKKLATATQQCLLAGSRSPQQCFRDFRNTIINKFNVYRPKIEAEDPRYGDENYTKFTGYYTPVIDGKLTADDDYQWGVYARPKNEALKKSTREMIDFEKKLDPHGYAMFYINDLYTSYLAHVEGGAKICVRNKDNICENYYLSYDGTNRQPFKFISIYMMKKGYIKDSSIASQRQFLKKNPHLRREIYRTCPSYVYFKISDHPPEGSDVVPLTDNRSIATDTDYYPLKGAISFFSTKRIDPNSKDNNKKFINYSRFALDQDTGGAINGKARVDIYYGEGSYAERAAMNQNHNGKLFFLMLKK